LGAEFHLDGVVDARGDGGHIEWNPQIVDPCLVISPVDCQRFGQLDREVTGRPRDSVATVHEDLAHVLYSKW